MKSLKHYISILFVLSILTSCDSFLQDKPSQKLVVPETLADLQGLLDNPSLVGLNHSYLPELFSDDFYINHSNYNAIEDDGVKNGYVWSKDLFRINSTAWNNTYNGIYYCNTVLEQIDAVPQTGSNIKQMEDIKGQAHYYRAKFYLLAASIWCQAYDPANATTALGLPLRTGTDFNVKSVRAPLGETYDLILADLRQAAALLNQPKAHPLRPSKTAAFGLLARACLFMRNYRDAGVYADSCLRLQSSLLDYNTLNATETYPIKYTNPEVILLNRIGSPSALRSPIGKIDTNLYRSYETNDLRKTLFFMKNADNTYSFRGGYEGNGSFFGGLATDEIYLIRAECYAREGKVSEAMSALNVLLSRRWKTGTFVPLVAANAEEALSLILRERRKELLFRTLRWPDIKRLNKEGLNLSLKRSIGDKQFELPANDVRFAAPIPEEVIDITGMLQNP
ncbi:RagB/SusD family nutrient uptake outer membrane protein [Desertivirga arenae]|uniref:RagB/SusD family nutrient uptake outer membrane protein n=1 Tax=Desertivirga arenae TaxID=2810309 RepID=UPI001A962718|nr:RagB/SusD family nutrient uptake outer membrane protein [Pedobacter sp. SYSU D00823]